MVKFLLPVFLLIGLTLRGQPKMDSLNLANRNEVAVATYLVSPDSAIRMVTATLADARRLKLRYTEAQCFFLLSKANWAKANFRLSLEYGYKALRFFENTRYTIMWHQSVLSIGRDLLELGDLVQSRKMIDKALQLAAKSSDDNLRIDTWREYSLLLTHEGLYDSAIKVADMGLQLGEKIGNSRYVGILYNRKARAYFLLHQYEKSIAFNKLSVQSDKGANNNRLLCIDLYQSAENYLRVHKLEEALRQLKMSDSLAVYIGNLPRSILCHQMMADIFEEQRNTTKAMKELRWINHMKDSLHQHETSRLVEEAVALNELENKEQEIKLLETENKIVRQNATMHTWISWVLAGGVILLIVIVILLSVLRRHQSRANLQLADKNMAIEQQREEISMQAENLQRLNQLKVKLFSVISHDLRGPITNLQVLLDMLTQKMMTPEEFLALSGKLKVDVSINQRTLENLLAWSMSQMEGIKTDPRNIELNVLIEEVSRLMREIAGRKGITVRSDIAGNFSVCADHNQVQLILRNIIHNAVKFSQHDSVIVIGARADEQFCRISIHDQGVGLTAHEIEILSTSHEYFTRVGTQQEKGTGLGWLLCKEFIRRNGGTFEIKSAPGEGTEVSFTLPLI